MTNRNNPFHQLNLSICRKAKDTITYQNNPCVAICGNRQNEFCRECSDKVYRDTPALGLKPRFKISDNDVRIIVRHKELDEEVVFLTSVDSKISKTILSFLKTPDLTKQEYKVLKLMCEGYANEEIQNLLCISKATLKSHINHLHQKIPDLIKFRQQYITP